MSYMFIGSLILVTIIQACTLRLSGTPHNQVILENTLSTEYLAAPQVRNLAQEYKNRLMQIAAGFSFLSIGLLFISYESIFLTFFWILLFSSMVAMFFCKVHYVRKMQELLIANNWLMPVKPILVDTQLILVKNQKMVSGWWLLPPLLVWILGSIYSVLSRFEASWLMIILSGVFLFLSFGSWLIVGKLPVRALTDNRSINQQYNDLTKHHWSLMMVSISWVLIPLLFIPAISLSVAPALEMILLAFFFLLIINWTVFSFWYLYSLRKKQDQLLAQVPSYRYLGDDQYWRFGVYYNPNDPRLFIPSRMGMNMGLNLGRPVGKLLMGLTGIIIIVAFVVTLVPAYLYDFTANPFQYEQTATNIELKASFVTTSDIPLDTIEKVELLEKLPNNITKLYGSATNNYATGKFTVDGKAATLYVDHQTKQILHIVTPTRDYYYTNKQPQKTADAYQQLQQVLEQ